MDRTIRVLVIEDAQADGDRIKSILTAENISCEVVVAHDEAEFAEALETDADVIVAGRSSTALPVGRVIEMLRAADLDLPLLVVSDSDDEVSVELMRAGATDCCRLARLPRALLREVSAVRTRKAHSQAGARQKHYYRLQKSLLRHVGGWLFRLSGDQAGRILFLQGERALLRGLIGRDGHLDASDELTWRDLVDPIDEPLVEEKFQDLLRDGGRVSIEFRSTGVDGALRWLRATVAKVTGPDGITIEGYLEDATDQRAASEKLRLLSRIVDQTAEAVLLVDNARRITYVNAAYEALTGYTMDDLAGKPLDYVHDGFTTKEEFDDMARALMQGETLRKVFVYRRKSGELLHEEKTISLLYDDDGQMVGAVSTGHDVTEALQNKERLDYLQYHDALTDLPNRAKLEQELADLLSHADDTGSGVGIFVINLDRFRYINEGHGYAEGDRLLQLLASRLREVLGDKPLLARLTGDFFAAAVEGLTGEAIATFAADLYEQVSGQFTLTSGDRVYINVSVGATGYPADSSGASDLIANAQAALNQAKRAGGGVQMYDAATRPSARRRLNLMAELYQTVQQGKFHLLYQPQISLRSGDVVGFEMLLRWRREDGTEVSPAEMIPLLEQSGLILDVGDRILRAACVQYQRWVDAGLSVGSLSVNISPAQLGDEALINRVQGALSAASMDPRNLILEVTESVFLSDIDAHLAMVDKLKALGVRIALDDFGTGYSSLGYLRHFPVDIIKIDRTFIREISTKPGDAAITRAMISMGHALGLVVMAEGVESPAQLGYLRQQGCDAVQGYYYDRPLDVDQVEEMLRERRHRDLPELTSASQDGTLLVVDDDPAVRKALRRLLRREGYRVVFAESADAAFEQLAINQVEVVLADQRMPGTDGTDLLKAVKHMYPDTVRMVFSGYTDLTTVTEAVNSGAIYKFITKPWDDDELRRYIRDAFDWRRQQFELAGTPPSELLPA